MEQENKPSLTEVVARESGRLRGFIRRRVRDLGEAEDILQDVLADFVRAWHLPEPIEEVGAWLFRVARNRIIDRYRKRREASLPDAPNESDGDSLDLVLPALDGGPEAAYARAALLEAMTLALEELPANQREAFIAHELDGMSFKVLAEQSGVNVNTLLSWKRRAVLHLRERLQPFYDELL